METKRKTKNNKKLNILGLILAILQLLITGAFLGLIFYLNVIPNKFLAPLCIILIGLIGLTFYTQLSRHGAKVEAVFSVLICIILCIGSLYVYKANNMFSDITSDNIKTDNVSVIVLKDNPAETLTDAAAYTFGIQETIARDNTDYALQSIKDNLRTQIQTKGFTEFTSQVDALYNGEVGAIIINEAYRSLISDTYADFDEKTKVLSDYRIETQLEIIESTKPADNDSYTIYISGIDTYGPISSTSRSDVNIIATVNPNTKTILLTTTPRDYYVPLPISKGVKDKLTHAGIYGVDVSMGTLESLYGITLDYYVRVNFNSLIDIIDALGGVNVNSEYAFTGRGYNYTVGNNQMDGAKALAFARERYAFSSGDNQRGENQLEIIKGIINKSTSSSIIVNAGSLMDSISSSMETNVPTSMMTSIIKQQVNEGTPWTIEMNSVVGTGDMNTTYSMGGQMLYVMNPNQASVNAAKAKMQEVMAGK